MGSRGANLVRFYPPTEEVFIVNTHNSMCRCQEGCWSLVPHGLGMGSKYALGEFLLTCHGNRLFDRRDPVFSKQL